MPSHSDGCQGADDPLLTPESFEIDVQRSGKKKKAQHAVQQGFVEINAVDQQQRIFLQAESQ